MIHLPSLAIVLTAISMVATTLESDLTLSLLIFFLVDNTSMTSTPSVWLPPSSVTMFLRDLILLTWAKKFLVSLTNPSSKSTDTSSWRNLLPLTSTLPEFLDRVTQFSTCTPQTLRTSLSVPQLESSTHPRPLPELVGLLKLSSTLKPWDKLTQDAVPSPTPCSKMVHRLASLSFLLPASMLLALNVHTDSELIRTAMSLRIIPPPLLSRVMHHLLRVLSLKIMLTDKLVPTIKSSTTSCPWTTPQKKRLWFW